VGGKEENISIYLMAPSRGGCEEGMGGGWEEAEIPLNPDMLEEVMEAGPVCTYRRQIIFSLMYCLM
jgi:hypothetical protein